MPAIGVVVIGRNEGESLKQCIDSLDPSSYPIVYVDSGSSDGSVEFIQSKGIRLVKLDNSAPFSAARARNEGMQYLYDNYPNLSYIQFVDGDCVVSEKWTEIAAHELSGQDSLAIVCGRRREKFPDQSIYNRLCDMEWNTPVGDTQSCGGDFMAKAAVLKMVDGFDPAIVAGEEPELCYRLRLRSYVIRRIDADMTLHDAKLLTFSQWWRRTIRAGHAYVHNMILHWGEAERFNQRQVASIIFWGLLFPIVSLILGVVLIGLIAPIVFVLVFIFMTGKISYYMHSRRGFSFIDSTIYGFFTMLGKIAQSIGVIKFLFKFLKSEKFEIIEYKNRG